MFFCSELCFSQVFEIQGRGVGVTEQDAVLEAKKNLSMRLARDVPYEKIFAELTKIPGPDVLETSPIITALPDGTVQATYRIFSTDVERYIELLDEFIETINDPINNRNGRDIATRLENTEEQMNCYIRFIPLFHAVRRLGGKYNKKPKLAYETVALRLKMLKFLEGKSAENPEEEPFITVRKIELAKNRYIEITRTLGAVSEEKPDTDHAAKLAESATQAATTEATAEGDTKSTASTESLTEEQRNNLLAESIGLRNEIDSLSGELAGKTFRAQTGSEFLHLDTSQNDDGSWNYITAFHMGDKVAFLNEGASDAAMPTNMGASVTYRVKPEHFYSIDYLISPISSQIINEETNRPINRETFSRDEISMAFTEDTVGIKLPPEDIIPFAQAGDKQAQYILANMYRDEKNFPEAINWLEPLTEENYRDSADIYDEILSEILKQQSRDKESHSDKFEVNKIPQPPEQKKFPVDFGLGIIADLLATVEGEVLSDDFFITVGLPSDLRGKSFFGNKFNPRVGIFFLAEYTFDFFKKPSGQFAVSFQPELTWTMKNLKKGNLNIRGDGTYYSATYSYHTLNLTLPLRVTFAGFFLAVGPSLDFALGNFPFTFVEEIASSYFQTPISQKSGTFKTSGVSMRLSMEVGYQFAFEHIILSLGFKAAPQIAENSIKRSLIAGDSKFDFFGKEPKWLFGGTVKVGYRF